MNKRNPKVVNHPRDRQYFKYYGSFMTPAGHEITMWTVKRSKGLVEIFAKPAEWAKFNQQGLSELEKTYYYQVNTLFRYKPMRKILFPSTFIYDEIRGYVTSADEWFERLMMIFS